MIRTTAIFIFCFFAISLLSGCHAGQEKAWESALEIARARIAEDESLSKNVDRIDLERRQFVTVFIKNQIAQNNFSKITFAVTKIVGEELFKQEGNGIKELYVYGYHVDGTELVVCKYTPSGGATVEKDRTMTTM